jgi:cholesterol transport system auxiliary component
VKRAVAIAGLVLVTSGCALFSRGSVLPVRYFSPEPAAARHPSPAEAQGPRPAIRLGRVRGAAYLGRRIAHRESEYEVGFYDDREWTERPEAYVRRALARKLFEERGFERVTGGPGPTLDVEVFGFEEVRMPGIHAARLKLRYRLQGDEAVLVEQTITIDRPVSGEGFDAFVAAMSEALDEATDRIADRLAAIARCGNGFHTRQE